MFVNDNWLYYQNDIDDKPDKLYRISLDGNKKELVIENDIDHFIIIDNWIYYINYENDEDKVYGGRIYRMRLDGSFKSMLSDVRALYFDVTNDKIIYNNEKVYHGFYVMDINGHNNIKISDDAFDIRVDENYLYYTCFSEGSILAKFDLTNKQKTVLEDEYVELIDAYDGWIYYIIKNSEFNCDGSVDEYDTLCRMRIDGTEKTEIFSGSIGEAYIYSDYIYIIDLTSTKKHPAFGGNIKRLSFDGSEIIDISQSKSGDLYFDEEWIIYIKKARFTDRSIFRGICRIKIDGTGYKTLVKGCCNIYEVKDGWIYYKILGKQIKTNLFEVQLRKIRVNGADDSFISEFEVDDYRVIKSGHL